HLLSPHRPALPRLLLFFTRRASHRHLHSFPTRRSSDLRDRDEAPRSPPEATRRRPTRAAITMAPPIPNTATSTSEFTPTIVPPHPASSDPGRAGPSMLHERAVDLEGRTGSGKGSGALDVLHPGTGGALDHAKTGRHTLPQIRHMADHAHRTATFTQPVQDLQDLLQGVLV